MRRSTPLRSLRLVLAALGVAVTVLLTARVAPAAPIDPRANALKARVVEWYEARKGLLREKCPRCAGFGGGPTTNQRWVNCPRCEGRKSVLATKAYRKLFFDMRSPAWRARATAQDEATAAYLRADRADVPPREFIAKYQVDRVEVDGAGGTAWALENDDPLAHESHWIWARDPKTNKDDWWVHTPETDGAWPPALAAAEEGLALESADAVAVRQRVGLAVKKHDVRAATRVRDVLLVGLYDKKAADETTLREGGEEDAIAATRAAFEAVPWASALRVDLVARFRDKFGKVRLRPYRRLVITRAEFEKIHLDNLKRDEVIAIYGASDLAYPDEVLWWKD